MIKNTYADCKVKDIKISGNKAYLTIIIASSKPATETRVFNFYVKDKDKRELTLLSSTNYWIDRRNNYENSADNVDINLYKQIVLDIDISNQNKSEMKDNKWVRICQLVLVDVTKGMKSNAWYSPELELVSKEIAVPKIIDLTLTSDKEYNLNISWIYKYEYQEDFNYNNDNLYTTVTIKSPYTNNVLETVDLYATEDNLNHMELNCIQSYRTPIVIEIFLKNLKGDVLNYYSQFYSPVPRLTQTYIKTNEGVKRVIAFFVKEKEGNV